jgi:hypothetical protein
VRPAAEQKRVSIPVPSQAQADLTRQAGMIKMMGLQSLERPNSQLLQPSCARYNRPRHVGRQSFHFRAVPNLEAFADHEHARAVSSSAFARKKTGGSVLTGNRNPPPKKRLRRTGPSLRHQRRGEESRICRFNVPAPGWTVKRTGRFCREFADSEEEFGGEGEHGAERGVTQPGKNGAALARASASASSTAAGAIRHHELTLNRAREAP